MFRKQWFSFFQTPSCIYPPTPPSQDVKINSLVCCYVSTCLKGIWIVVDPFISCFPHLSFHTIRNKERPKEENIKIFYNRISSSTKQFRHFLLDFLNTGAKLFFKLLRCSFSGKVSSKTIVGINYNSIINANTFIYRSLNEYIIHILGVREFCFIFESLMYPFSLYLKLLPHFSIHLFIHCYAYYLCMPLLWSTYGSTLMFFAKLYISI